MLASEAWKMRKLLPNVILEMSQNERCLCEIYKNLKKFRGKEIDRERSISLNIWLYD